ncbi:MAG: hypothetical protein KJN60_07830 [Boseongicola sp.]|nr:hypothetical protein [Boseongicola sp.]
MTTFDPNQVAATEFGKVRLFSTELDPQDAANITAQNVQKLLGKDIDLDTSKVEVITSKAIEAIGLRQYLITGYGIAEADLKGKAAALDALTGLIILIPSSAFKGKEQTLDPNPALRFIGTFSEEAASAPGPMTPRKSAEGDLTPGPGHARPLPNAGRSWIGAFGALLIAAAIVLYFVL